MRVLVVAEHDGITIRPGSRSAIHFAQSVAASTSGCVELLILGHDIDTVAEDAARFAAVALADSPALRHPVADRFAKVIAEEIQRQDFDLVCAAATTFAKDIVTRAAGLLGGTMASDVVGHRFEDGQLLLRRPMYAGSLLATVKLNGHPLIVTVRPSAYSPASPSVSHGVRRLAVDLGALPSLIEWVGTESRATTRPEVTEAAVVVAGGRVFKNAEEFEQCVGRLADKLGGAVGCTRALVDAGITPNEWQVGQTGKIVAPDLYIALGVSGAIQHLAGMKNSKIIVAINNDPEAPIFQFANYGLVADVHEVVPRLIEYLGDS